MPASDPVVDLLADLVAIPSVNPSLAPGAPGERDVAEFIAASLRAAGCDVIVREVADGRPNVVAIIDSGRPGPALMFCGHTDTVGVHGMTAPYAPVVRNGCLFGRGAQDMKGGLAAMIHAAHVLARDGGIARGRVILAAVADEEYASIGAEALIEDWTADAAVIPEPTDLEVGIAHKGFSAAEVIVHGRAAHGSRPAEGIDAILHAGRVLGALDARDRGLQASAPHPLLGTASLHAGTIAGGTELSTYPARCTFQCERRTLPGEREAVIMDELAEILQQLTSEDARFRADVRLLLARPAYEIDGSHPLPRAMLRAATSVKLDSRVSGCSFWTDAAILATRGTPAILFGPRGAGLHGVEEYVRLDDVVGCRNAFVALARDWCGDPV